MTKLAPLSAVLLSQFVAADAGSVEAQHDARLCAVYGAYRTALKSGNKTQLMLVQAATDTYKDAKACRALTDTPDRPSAQATRAASVYGAYKLALQDVGIPGLLRGADDDTIEAEATACAGRFVAIVTAALARDIKPVATKEERAAAKAKRDADKAKAEAAASKEHASAVKAAAEKIANARTVTLAEMVAIVADALRMGMLDDESVNTLAEAADVHETRALLAMAQANPGMEVGETAH